MIRINLLPPDPARERKRQYMRHATEVGVTVKVRPPSEAFEAQRLIAYLDSRGYRYSHVASEASSKHQRVKNARAGVRRGVPDYLILHPTAGIVFIELKRIRGGRISAEQKEWIAALNAAGVPAAVCAGFLESKTWLENLLANGNPRLTPWQLKKASTRTASTPKARSGSAPVWRSSTARSRKRPSACAAGRWRPISQA